MRKRWTFLVQLMKIIVKQKDHEAEIEEKIIKDLLCHCGLWGTQLQLK